MHEIDGAYWKEWKFFGKFGESLSDRKGLSIYLYAHIPILLIMFFGLISLDNYFGLIVSAILSGFMIFHFFIHQIAKKTTKEFSFTVSTVIFYATLIISLVQFSVTVAVIIYN
jgi:hypothetical protein